MCLAALMMGDAAACNGVHATQEVIAILDAGAQYAKVIDRKVRVPPTVGGACSDVRDGEH